MMTINMTTKVFGSVICSIKANIETAVRNSRTRELKARVRNNVGGEE